MLYVSHSTISKTLTEIDKGLIRPFLKDILQQSFKYLQTGCSVLKENAVSTIAAAAEASKDYFHPFFDEAMPILFNILGTHL